jgi:uncharacterized RDD family membrane protein YckC
MSTPAPEPLPAPPAVESFSFGGYVGTPGGIEGVGFWQRVGARIIDLLVHYFVSLCAGFLFGILLAIAAAMTGQSLPLLLAKQRQHSGIALFVLALLGSVVYHTICEGVHGSTLGKLIFSMTVMQEDGSPCRLKAALIRDLGYFVDSLFFGLIGFLSMQGSPQQQRHGDKWAHTIVCKRALVPPGNLRSNGRFVLGLFLGAMVDAALILLGLLLKLMG